MNDLVFLSSYKGDRAAFAKKVIEISRRLDINPNWLMATMYRESRLNPSAQNTRFPLRNGYATGLIQFTPDTARWLNTSTDALKTMSGTDQLNYVEWYFQKIGAAGKMNSYFDVYMAVFFPAAIGFKDTDVIKSRNLSASRVAQQNPAIDLNSDGVITVKEFKEYLVKGFSDRVKKAVNAFKHGAVDNLLPLAAFVALIYAYHVTTK